MSLAAIAFGATAVIFAFGLNSSLTRAAQSQTNSATVPVQIQESQNGPQSPSATQTAAMTAVLRAQPGTAHYVALYGNQVKVAGIADGPAGFGTATAELAEEIGRASCRERVSLNV